MIIIKKLFILIFIAIILCGCNYIALNELFVVTTLGVDRIDNKYKLTAELAKLSPSDKESGLDTEIVTAEGETFSDALSVLSVKVAGHMYLNQCSVIVFGENAARQGVFAVIESIVRNPQFHKTARIVTVKNGDAAEILQSKPLIRSFISVEITDLIASAEKDFSKSITIKSYELFGTLSQNYFSVLPAVKTEDKKVYCDGLAVLKNENLIGFLNSGEAVLYAFINNQITSAMISTDNASGTVTANKTIKKENNLSIDFKIAIREKNNQKNLEKSFETQIEQQISEFIITCRERFNDDIFGFDINNPIKIKSKATINDVGLLKN